MTIVSHLSTLLLCLGHVTVDSVAVVPRHCRGNVKHLHLSVGKDPTTEMTISFASKWSHPDVEAPIGGIHIGLHPDNLDRFVGEQEYPISYDAVLSRHHNEQYYSPYQHHFMIDGLKPNTTYYYVAVVGDRDDGIEALEAMPLRDHPSQHVHHDNTKENLLAENAIIAEGNGNDTEEDSTRWLLRHRQLAPPPYDGHDKPCVEAHKVRSFRTAPETNTGPTSFAIIGDLGQFDHSQETLEHMRDHRVGIDAVVLVGDIAYTEYDHRRWDTFFDFLDDFSVFDEIPLQVAIGNHDIDKQENGNEIFQAYDTRFLMPHVFPPELGTFDGPSGLLNMDAPPYPLPYEWGNAYYSFTYGPAKHIVINAYSSMEPGSKQYVWVQSELKTVDRSRTPWVLVTLHTPLYNTFALHPKDLQIKAAKEHMEPLFVEHKVNVVFTGHIHAYQRTKNIAMDEVVNTGPIHITVGAGGRKCDAPYKSEIPEPWLEKRDASYYGYGRFEISNATHAEWRWIPLSASDLHDYNVVKGEEENHLPQLEHDALVVENQYFIEED